MGMSIPAGYPAYYAAAVSAAQQQYGQQYAGLLPTLSTSPDLNGLQSVGLFS